MKINKLKEKVENKNKKYRNIFGVKIEKIENLSLTSQLIIITIVSLAISALSLLVFIPSILKPFYEENMYNYLRQPANYIQNNDKKIDKNMTYIIITNSGAKLTSSNYTEMFGNTSIDTVIKMSSKTEGSFRLNLKTYYYVWGGNEKNSTLVITNNSQIKAQEEELLSIIFPTMLITTIITTMLLFMWSKYILNKIKILNRQASSMTKFENDDNICNEPYFVIDDELNSLSNTMTKTKETLKQKEEYKNLMFQNMSHELKTPISVIKSYVEAVKDKMVTEKESIKVISEEIETLSKQVNMLLQISKIDYMKDEKELNKVDVIKIIKDSVDVHIKIKKDLNFNINKIGDVDKIEYFGLEELYKTVFDNILGNFIRYAKKEVNINISNEFIQFINDGENIDKGIINNIFLPYVKGKGGESGLGLSIVKRIIEAFGYTVRAENLQNGVMFEIRK